MLGSYAPVIVAPLTLFCAAAGNAQMLETETSRLQPARTWELGAAYEYQTSGDASEQAVPLFIEYGLTDAIELTLEPVVYTAIFPGGSASAIGRGDTEFTATFLFAREGRVRPALSLAAEVNFPIATNTLIGTGETDYALYQIGSKRFGKWDLSAIVGFTYLGSPPGVYLGAVFNGAFAAVYHASREFQLFTEVFGNSASAYNGESGGGGGSSVVIPEATGSEVVGTLGIAPTLGSKVLAYLGVSYDTNNAVLFRPGFTVNLP